MAVFCYDAVKLDSDSTLDQCVIEHDQQIARDTAFDVPLPPSLPAKKSDEDST
jgi:hypothetical protein